MLSINVGVPKLLRGEIWWLMVEQHKLHYPAKDIQSPCRDYQDLLKDLTEYQHNILIDLGELFCFYQNMFIITNMF
jgi:hypothetical protein